MTGTIVRRGKASWRLKYDLPRDHKTGRRRIAYATVRGTRADAEREMRRLLTAIDRGVAVEPSRLTVAQFMERWLTVLAPENVAPKALERYAGLVRHQINPYLGPVQIQKLRPATVQEWLRTLAKTGISSRSVRHAHGVLRSALSYAAGEEIIERNVASMVRLPKLKRAKVEILTADEIADALRKLEGHSLYPIAALALGTGVRRGEIVALRWSDWNTKAGTLRIERSLEKTGSGKTKRLRLKLPKTDNSNRTISLPEFTVTALRDHRRQTLELRIAIGAGTLPADAPMFGDLEGNWLDPDSISDRWRETVKTRKLPKVTFHALRHTHASALIAAKLDVVAISRRLGHANPAITLSVYAHLFENCDDEAADAMQAAMSSGANRVPK